MAIRAIQAMKAIKAKWRRTIIGAPAADAAPIVILAPLPLTTTTATTRLMLPHSEPSSIRTIKWGRRWNI